MIQVMLNPRLIWLYIFCKMVTNSENLAILPDLLPHYLCNVKIINKLRKTYGLCL